MDPNPFSRGPTPHWESASQKRLRAADAGLPIPAVTLLHFSCGVLGVPPSHPLIALRLLVAAVSSAPCRAVPGPSPVGESSISVRVSLNVLLKTTHAGCTPLVGGPQPSVLRVKGLWDVASAGPYPQEQRNHILALSLPDVPNPHNSPGLLQSSGHACLCTRGAVTRALFSLQGLLPRTCSPHAVGR